MLFTLLLDTSVTITRSELTAVYIALGGTLSAAVLAALSSFRASNKASNTAREVALLSSQSAQELKDKDYKNDYYKKVIEKRMGALEDVTKVLGLFASSHVIGEMNIRCHSYFYLNKENLEGPNFNIQSVYDGSSATWRSKNTSIALTKFLEIVVSTIVEVNHTATTTYSKLVLYANKYEEISSRIREVENCIGQDMKSLYDVEAFLKERFS